MKTTFTFGMMLILMSMSSCILKTNAQEKQPMNSPQALDKTMPCKMTSEPVPGAEIIVDLASGKRATCQTNEHGIFAIYLSNSDSDQTREKTIMAKTSITPPQNLHSTIANKNIELTLNKAEGNYFEFQLLGEQATSNSQTCKITILPLQSKKINKAEEIPLEKGSHSGGQKRGEVAQF
ncbi:MAG: hypothetical protein ACP5F6_07410 [Microbacter sp.]